MQRLLGLAVLLTMFAGPAIAQDVPASSQTPDAAKAPVAAAPQDKTAPAATSVSKTEISGGFTFHRYYEITGDTITMPGGYADVEHNILQRWLGAEIQLSGAYKNLGAPGTLEIYTIMAGPTFYPLGHRKITVFGDVLAGEGYYRNSIAASAGFPSQINTHTSLAWGAGGGIDLNVSRRLSVRLVRFDYTKMKFFAGTAHESDTRVSVGIVYHFGVR